MDNGLSSIFGIVEMMDLELSKIPLVILPLKIFFNFFFYRTGSIYAGLFA